MASVAQKPHGLFKSSIGKKSLMGLTGLFLITFLIVHCFVNQMVFWDKTGMLFNEYAHFMGNNVFVRMAEWILFAGLLLHIIDGLMLFFQNRAARPVKYVHSRDGANSSWYSRSMALLGTLLLLFLILHLSHFWVKSRFTGVPFVDDNGHQVMNLYGTMFDTFSNLWVVIVYCLALVSLSYHLLHGFWSAFQTLGLNHTKYNQPIHKAGTAFAIIIPIIFALMPIVIYLRANGMISF
jgi:succinate dehydrogenase / fumarate reductase cytochrome b subunit